MKNFALNDESLDKQLAIRLYNLEQLYNTEFIIRNIMQALVGNEYSTYEDEFYLPVMELPNHSLYIHSCTIVKYFGHELVTRFISFNYGNEVDCINKELAA